jgi:hypothetical protein
MLRQRGSTVIEILVASMIAFGVIITLTGFFLMTLKVGKEVDAQAAVQRQGGAIADELGRQLRVVNGSPQVEDPLNPPVAPVCLPLTATPTASSSTSDPVLVIPSLVGGPLPVTCYYRDTSSPPQLRRCRRSDPGADCVPAANLLSGSLTPLSASAWSVTIVPPCVAIGGTCDVGVCSIAGESCGITGAATIKFTVNAGDLSETFGLTMAARNR